MDPVVIMLEGPLRVDVQQLGTGAPRTVVKARITVADEEYTFRTDMFTPIQENPSHTFISAALGVLRSLCVAWRDPDHFRMAALTPDPSEHGVTVAPTEGDIDSWIEAASTFGEKLDLEACSKTDKWWAGEAVQLDLR